MLGGNDLRFDTLRCNVAHNLTKMFFAPVSTPKTAPGSRDLCEGVVLTNCSVSLLGPRFCDGMLVDCAGDRDNESAERPAADPRSARTHLGPG
jgi:hypothetical protein